MDIVGRNFVALTFQGLVFFLLTILIQYRFFLRSFHYVNRIHPSEIQRSTSEDDDVLAERERIHSDPENNQNDILRMVDLVKVVKKTMKYELDDLFFYVDLWIYFRKIVSGS